jgi:hypothetical protein
MIQDPEWGRWSDNGIAKHCGVAQSFVSKIRHSLSLNSEISDEEPPSSARFYKDRWGHVHEMETARIGQEAPGPLLPVRSPPVTANGVSGDPDAQEGMSLPVATLAQPEGEVLLTQQSEMEQGGGTRSEQTPGHPTQAIFTEMEEAAPDEKPQGAFARLHSGDIEWYTPPEVIARVREVFGGTIDLDPASCADAQRVVGATTYYTLDDDGLRQPWHGRVFLNPPYKDHEIQPFLGKLVAELDAGMVTEAIVLVNNPTQTDWFQFIAPRAHRICFPDGKMHFWHPTRDGDAGPIYGQVVLYFGPQVARFEGVFGKIGFIAQPICAKDQGPQLDLAAQSIGSVRWRSLLEAGHALTLLTGYYEQIATLRETDQIDTQALQDACTRFLALWTPQEPPAPAPPAPGTHPAPPALSPIEAQLLAHLKALAPQGCTQKQGAEAIGKLHTSTTQAWSRLLTKGLVRKEDGVYHLVEQERL